MMDRQVEQNRQPPPPSPPNDYNPLLPALTREQTNIIAVIAALLSFIIILILYKCVKHLRRRSGQSRQVAQKKFKNVVLVNNHLSKPDLKPIGQQFQINTAYASQTNFNRLFPYHNVYDLKSADLKSSSATLSPAFCYSDVEIGTDQKNPSFDLENNLFLSKKFIKDLKAAEEKRQQKAALDAEQSEKGSINNSITNSIISSNNNNSTDSSDPKSEESDQDGGSLRRRRSQRLSVARPVSSKFNLLYSGKEKCLYVEILTVDNLIFNAKYSYFYVKVHLRDHTRELRFKSQKTKLAKGTTSVFFNESKQFNVNEFAKLADLTLQLSVYNRIRSLSRKQLVGDLLVDLSRPDLIENNKLMFEEHLTPMCVVGNKKLVPTYKTGELGFLRIELQLTNEKNDRHKIKVTLKNAQNLPLKYNSSLDLNKSNAVFMGHAEFYLSLNLFYGQEKLDTKETGSSFSNCPSWEQQIVFDVNEYAVFDEKFILDQNNSANRAEISRRLFRSKLKHLSLAITVVKGNFCSKHAAIGQVRIGDKGSVDGILHWAEMCNSNKPCQRWHEIRSLN